LIETEKDGSKALLLTKEVRREANGVDYRLPGGKVFDTLAELNKSREEGSKIMDHVLVAAKKKAGKKRE
jgi:hypothetical protein